MIKTAKRVWPVGLVACVASLGLLAPAASAEVLTATQNTDVFIPLSGNANPYPSTVVVSGADGKIADLNVNIEPVHTWPDDLDIVLVSPDGDEEVIMSDACGNGDLLEPSLTFSDEAAGPLADEGPCAGGTFKPTNVGAGDEWGPPGPGLVETALLSNFDFENPNGVWELYVLDDSPSDEGLIETWSLTITTQTADLILPGAGSFGPANPYPATRVLDTAPGTVIADLNVTTADVNHTHVDDLDLLLVGPRRGAHSMLMSDACGSNDIRHYVYTFDDEAGAPLSDSSILPGCDPVVVKPTDFEFDDEFPAPAPVAPYSTSLTAFDGLEGGAFSLFAVDDSFGDTGYISEWSLNATTRDAADTGFASSTAQASEGTTALLEVKRSGPPLLGPASLTVSAQPLTAGADDFSAPATLEFARGEATKSVAIPILADKAGEGAETVEVTLSAPRDDARLTGTKTATLTIDPSAAVVDPPADKPVTLPLLPISNRFTFGKLKRNAKKGTATLFVNVPGPGQLALSGKKVKAAKKAVAKAGPVALPVKAKGKALAVLDEKGSARLGVKVTFTPSGGSPLTLPKSVKLVLAD